jgi:histidine decarboxylase
MAANPLGHLPPVATQTVIDDLVAAFTAAQATNIGFPASTGYDYTPLAPLLRFLTNNLGDPQVDGAYPIHTKAQERAAINIIADLLHAPIGDRWGYVTSGATEGTEYALHAARTRYPDGIVYRSRAAHHSTAEAIDRLRMSSLVIRTDQRGEIDYDDLYDQIDLHRDRPSIVVATIGTGMTEAIDDVRRISADLDRLAADRRWVHADAALSGIPLALLDPGHRPGFDFADGADSVVVSGHKFLGTPVPCAAVVVRASLRPDGSRRATYTGSPNSTISNSRSGLAAFALWYGLHTYGPQLQQHAQHCRDLAAYACSELAAVGIDAWRHPHAFTVVVPTPPEHIASAFALPEEHQRSHFICMPGVTRDHIDRLVAGIRATGPMPVPVVAEPAAVPRQRRRGVADRFRIGAAQ